MTCRCPVCDQVLIVQGRLNEETVICCDRCDRGFLPRDARCEHCSGREPFSRRDRISYWCASCGATQYDPAAAWSA